MPLDLQAQAWKRPGILPEELEEVGGLDISGLDLRLRDQVTADEADRTQYPSDLNS